MAGVEVPPIEQILDAARIAGLEVAPEGDRLRIRGPKSAGHLAEALLERKEEVLDYLDRSCGHPLLLPESKAIGRCLKCLSQEQYLTTIQALGERHRRESRPSWGKKGRSRP